MLKDPHSDIFTVGIGGAAGDGVLEAGSNLGLLLRDLGYEVYLSSNYPSLIRGGHNFIRLSFGKEKVWNDHSKLDALIALNEETVKLHMGELNTGAVVFADSFEQADVDILGANAVAVPMQSSIKEINALAITRNSVALGALCYLLDLSLPKMMEILQLVFKDKSANINTKLADIGFEHLQKMAFRHTKKLEPSEPHGEFIDGNKAFGKGLLAAGLDFYVAYPMTPSSSILHYLAGKQTPEGLKVIQPENEIAAINMALGMAYTGKRVAVGSATGGFALMQEAFSFAGMAELPLVVAVSQRQAPATGMPTHSSQSDLRFVIHAGHGEFPRIVMAPGDSEESFQLGAEALNLAWKFQTPVIVLLDKILSEHMMTTDINPNSISAESGKMAENTNEGLPAQAGYGRYEITDDGISPMAFPGAENTVVKITSYEHDEKGITTEEISEVKKMLDKRFTKMESIKSEMQNQKTVKVYGDTQSKNAIVFFGSTKGPVLEAAKYFDKGIKLLQIVWLEPFDTERVKQELNGAERIICIEGNHNSQLASLIREKTGIEITEKILKYDSMPFDPVALAEEINDKMK
jgi:2-oxoglutarate/2-oxoacid ferredoxin oxidoreductase subunit alpha